MRIIKRMKIGFIGVGNIGSMLVRRFTEFIDPEDISIFDVDSKKCERLERGLGVKVSESIGNLRNESSIIFLCIRPQDLDDVLSRLKESNKIFVTTVAAINQETYYKKLGSVELIRIIPSMINKVGGPILFCSGQYTSKRTNELIKNQLSKIGKVFEVEEEGKMDAYTHIASCSPAISAEFLRLYVDSLARKEKIDKDLATSMIHEVLLITSQMLRDEGFAIIPQVCTRGGITEQGIGIMNEHKDTFFRDITDTLLDRMSGMRKEYGK